MSVESPDPSREECERSADTSNIGRVNTEQQRGEQGRCRPAEGWTRCRGPWNLGETAGRLPVHRQHVGKQTGCETRAATVFGREARAATLTTYQIRQYQLARRAAGAATGTINRETSALHRMGTLAVHWGWLDSVPGFPDRLRENPPRQGFFEHPEYLCVRAHLPAPWQDILDLAYYSGWRKNEIRGLTWDEIDEAGGVIRLSPRALEDVGGADSPHLATHCRDPRATASAPRPRQPAGLPPRRHPHPPLAHGVAHRLSGGRRTDPLPPRVPPHRRPPAPDVRRHATWPQSWMQRENWKFETHRVDGRHPLPLAAASRLSDVESVLRSTSMEFSHE